MFPSAPRSDTRPVLGVALRLVIDKKAIWLGVTTPIPEEGQQGMDPVAVLARLYEGYLGVYGKRLDEDGAMGYLLDCIPDQTRTESYAQLEKTGGSVVKLPEVIQRVRFFRAPPSTEETTQPVIRGMALRAFNAKGGGPFWFGKAYIMGSDPTECVNRLFAGARAVVPGLAAPGAKLLLLSEEPTEALMLAIEASATLAHPAVLDIMDEASVDVAWGPSVDGVH